MKFDSTMLKGNFLINLEKKEDDRGFFARYFCEKEFIDQGLNIKWVQINTSLSKQLGALRGLHYQKEPSAEIKLVRCLKGAIWDVVVDLRKHSDTYGKWFGAKLSDENRTMMYVPKGFAYGFVSLQPNTEILYLVSEFYTPNLERTLIWNDETVDINWPITPKIISDKDKNGDTLNNISPIKLKNNE